MTELRQVNSGLNIEIIGINEYFLSSLNHEMTAGHSLPWLQDNQTVNVWRQWNVTYRDVRILDAQNRLLDVYNLSVYDLGQPANYAALKNKFLNAARTVDSDADGLPDEWEVTTFSDLTASPAGDADGDGVENRMEFIFGSDPKLASSKPKFSPKINLQKRLTLSFRRWSGTGYNYTVESSGDLNAWGKTAPPFQIVQRNLFDGTGVSEATVTVTRSTALQPVAFLRILTSTRGP